MRRRRKRYSIDKWTWKERSWIYPLLVDLFKPLAFREIW